MSILSKFFSKQTQENQTKLEEFLQRYAKDRNYADSLIRKAQPDFKLAYAFCFSCFAGAHLIADNLRKSNNDLSKLSKKRSLFDYDSVVQELIAYLFYVNQSPYLNNDDYDADDESEKEQSLNYAIALADGTVSKIIGREQDDFLRKRVASYSLQYVKQGNIVEYAAEKIIRAWTKERGTLETSLADIGRSINVQISLTGPIANSVKEGIDRLYMEWERNPNLFD